jgi:cob(I)alamin adenosyltransferase
MAVHLTRIYTRTGDDGTTGLGDFTRVDKSDSRLIAYAECDEANAALGVAVVTAGVPRGTEVTVGRPDGDLTGILRQVQNDLFDVGADLCNPIVDSPKYPPIRITEPYIARLEAWCDEYNAELPALDSFILPGGTALAAQLHVARTVVRRAERAAWLAVADHPDTVSALPAKYLNRLSDLLFILSRVANPDGDVRWRPGEGTATELPAN